jgi:hypothetical protein
MSQSGHSRPMHSVPVPINVRCYSNSDQSFAASRLVATGQQPTLHPLFKLKKECGIADWRTATLPATILPPRPEFASASN